MLIIVGVLLLRGGSTRPARVVETSIALLDSDECGVVGVREVVYAVWMATPRAEGAHADAVEVVQLGVRGSEIGSNKPSMFQRPITCGSVAEDIFSPGEERISPNGPKLSLEVGVADGRSEGLGQVVDLEGQARDGEGPIKVPR